MKRREFLKLSAAAAAGAATFAVPGIRIRGSKYGRARAAKAYGPAAVGLSDPVGQPKFVELAPNALDPGFKFESPNNKYTIAVRQRTQMTGLVDANGNPLPTTVWGYGEPRRGGATWPGRTFEVQSGQPIEVKWQNKLNDIPHLLPVDTSLHWCYSLPGYEQFTIDANGVPIVTHLHGGHSDSIYDGNPEFFFSPGYAVRGPQWVEKTYTYANDQPAGNLWYHDHALGITRLNVWAGLAGFYFIRDDQDTGTPDNPLGIPAFPYELAYAIQDRMFRDTGEFFYSAYPGDPFYADFITGEGAVLPPELFPGGGPTALAEFFGDHMVVNGKIWPKENVEPRNYRMHLLNGTDSRFMVLRFRAAATSTSTDLTGAGAPIPFYVIGSDQGLASSATQTDTLVSEPGSRYDIVFDFEGLQDQRIIMENLGGDAPFGGDYGNALAPEDLFPDRQTDRIMAFDVMLPLDTAVADNFDSAAIGPYAGNNNPVDRVRKVALFEGMDEFGRLQPLLGTAEPATDFQGNPINWPDTPVYVNAGLIGQMEGSIAWHSPTTENPALGGTEIWEIYNATGDAHPVHLHLVNFQVGTGDEDGVTRQEFSADVIDQPVVQHNGLLGNGFRLENIVLGAEVSLGTDYVENAPKDMVTALPGQVTRIKMTFDKPGRYVWHCHILSHEDHEMMRVLHVGPGA